ncbi:hypothetical protein P2H44_17925 [Albimonas sp. CAU 1670]|uniref:hypothetical protein n=1 Tax=Albimonas sp. CAU 1670 TaxID=3032599 RepID=UPI0023D9E91A|nr:hypothetical protein [Albimonas sp. CAU 1670]MDF2234441.1 hypothetical protein [Albimonas sp. CAU 1670]
MSPAAPVPRSLRRLASGAALAAAALLVSAGAAFAGASEFDAKLRALAAGRLAAYAAEPAIVEAVTAQNAAGKPDQARIDQLDAEWRAQVGAPARPLVDEVMGRAASARLVAIRDESQGLIAEVILMDQVGLNVAVSEPTSDYWQGDEAKWSETYLVGPAAVHVSDVELDESTQTYQAQVSLPVISGGAPVGAITFGVNVEYLD